MSLLLAVVILALATFSGLTVYVVRAVLLSRIDQTRSVPDRSEMLEHIAQAARERDQLERRIDELTLAVDEGIRRVDRAENRIQKTVTSARRLVRDAGLEHAGIEAEHAELQSPDEEAVQPMPALPANVDPPRSIRVPGGQLEIGAA